jgi:hypothetical protein
LLWSGVSVLICCFVAGGVSVRLKHMSVDLKTVRSEHLLQECVHMLIGRLAQCVLKAVLYDDWNACKNVGENFW